MASVGGWACPLSVMESCGTLIQPYGGAHSGGYGVPRPTVAGGVFAHLRIVHALPDHRARSIVAEGYLDA